MPYNLTIDQGNSSAKLALWDEEGRMVDISSSMRFSVQHVTEFLAGRSVDAAIYCTVRRSVPSTLRALRRFVPTVITLDATTPSPLGIDYRSAATLGADRIAAAVGAWSLSDCHDKELLIIDIGTAVTYDRVSAEAVYLGGNIAPGLFMRLKALHHYTARLPLVDPREDAKSPLWGDDTKAALLAGALRGIVAETEYYHRTLGNEAKVIMTGGDARRIAGLLSFTPTIHDDLVSLGLHTILRFNLQNQN